MPKVQAWLSSKTNNTCTSDHAAVRREWYALNLFSPPAMQNRPLTYINRGDLSIPQREEYTKGMLCLES